MLINQPIDQVEPWISMNNLLNGWSNLAGGYAPASYHKQENQMVYLRGVVRFGTISGTSTGTIWTLPVGFRPAMREIFHPCSGNSTSPQPTRCDVLPDGTILALWGNNTYFSLSGICFRAEG